MTTTISSERRQRRHPVRNDTRRRATNHDSFAVERHQLLLSLKTIACVALTLVFLRLGIPGAAFVFVTVGFLLAGRSHPRAKPSSRRDRKSVV